MGANQSTFKSIIKDLLRAHPTYVDSEQFRSNIADCVEALLEEEIKLYEMVTQANPRIFSEEKPLVLDHDKFRELVCDKIISHLTTIYRKNETTNN